MSFFLSILFLTFPTWAAEKCERMVAQSLIEHLAGEDLSRWRDVRKFLNRDHDSRWAEGIEGVISARILADLLDGSADLNEVLRFVDGRLRELEGISRQRLNTSHSTREIGGKLTFHSLKYQGSRLLDLSETVVTEKVWLKVMGSAPENSKDFFLGNDFPVRKVKFGELKEFLVRLNQGQFLASEARHEVLDGHREGDVYRLMTFKEQMRLAHLLYEELKTQDVLTRTNLGAFAHYSDVATDSFEPTRVGTKEPIFIQGKPFYDLIGNVLQLLVSRYHLDSENIRFSWWGGSAFSVFEDFVPRAHGLPTALRQIEKPLSSLPEHEGLLSFRLMRVRMP